MNTIEKTFTIPGMSCGGCVNSLTRVLKSVPGIEPIKIEVGKAQSAPRRTRHLADREGRRRASRLRGHR